ncbi:MAG: KH domain-containing protein [Candidatus Gracilibacteria bacterium]|nr:KH domain-containing protein [Candidatus Gracilibacteria bacterium]
MKNEIKSLTQEFFDRLNIKIDSLDVVNEDNANIFNIIIKTGESGLIIGPNGRNLDSIQNILKLMISNKVGEKVKIHLEINDYIKSKDDRLFDFIKSKIEYVKKTKKDFCLPFYSAYERKKIHGFISEMKSESIFTKSIGEGKDRRLHIFIQEKKLELDIDGDDI